MKSRKEALRTAKTIFAVSFTDGQIDLGTVKKVIRKISETRPRGYIQVADAYWRLVKLEMEKNRAVIQSAIELDAKTKDQVVKDLQKKYGMQIAPEFTVNPELLGGMKIRVGSDVWDGSVKNRLERLSENFN